MDLLLAVAEELGLGDDKELAALAGVSPESVANWRSGSVREFKPQKLVAVKQALAARLRSLREQAHAGRAAVSRGLVPVEVEEGSSPAALQRQFRDRVLYDYLGHRFLYFDPQGALAWENLISTGYDQDRWLQGAARVATAWLDGARDSRGGTRGPLADAFGLTSRGGRTTQGMDVLSLGPGEGGKEALLLERLFATERTAGTRLPWVSLALVDVSIPLLLKATTEAYRAGQTQDHLSVMPFCADFEEGPLTFVERLPTAKDPGVGTRLVLMLGNVFGNLRDEETFLRQRLFDVLRPGDWLWLEVGIRPERLADDPLFRMTEPGREITAAEATRNLLLEGPFRRWEAAMGRAPSRTTVRVWVREDDDSSRIPGSANFCHDLVLEDERRVCTMLYSRRYGLEGLTPWLEALGLEVVRIEQVEDSRNRPRVAHLLSRRTP